MNEPTIAQVDAAIRAVLNSDLRREIPRENVFAGRLLGQKHAEEIAENVKEICIEPGTIITPLGRDLLKRRQIEIVYAASESRNQGEWGFAVEVESGTTAAVRGALLKEDSSWLVLSQNLLEVADWVATGPQRGAVVLAQEASITCWLANQTENVRASVASEPDDVSRAIRALGVNLLVIEPAGKSISWIRHLIKTFRRGGIPKHPEHLATNRIPKGDAHENRRSDRPRDAFASASSPAERALRDRLAHAALGFGRRVGGSG